MSDGGYKQRSAVCYRNPYSRILFHQLLVSPPTNLDKIHVGREERVACELRRISGCQTQPEIHLCSQAKGKLLY